MLRTYTRYDNFSPNNEISLLNIGQLKPTVGFGNHDNMEQLMSICLFFLK